MDNTRLPKNFTLSRESMKAMLEAFKASKSAANVTREVFQVVAPASVSWTPALAPALVLASIVGGSHSAASKASALAKVSASTKSPAASKHTPKEPIPISESDKGSSKWSAEVAPLDI